MQVIFMGTPEFAVPALRQLVLNDYQVVAVYTQPDKPSGRGRQPVSSPAKKAAQALKLPVVQPFSLKKADVAAELAGFKPDIIVVAAFGKILPEAVLNIPKWGAINVHPSLLPRHRGASPVASAIMAGDEFTGVSIMLMDEGMDTGPVLSRAQIPVSDSDNTGSLTSKLSVVSAHLLQDVLSSWLKGQLIPQPQDEDLATYSSIITKESGKIDWRLSAVDIWRRVRAFHPWPGCYTSWQSKILKIIGAVPIPQVKPASIGQVVAVSNKDSGIGFGINTGDGVLGLIQVQLEGKRVMSAAEFMRGQRQFIGAVLPS